jgi:muramoyltetrapeptide carboxypeptidase
MMIPNRIHLLAHSNPLGPDALRFGFADVAEYIAFARAHLPPPLRLTCSMPLMEAVERDRHGGRNDDARRIRDVQAALNDRRTLAIVAASGGAYFTRLLPHLDFGGLRERATPLWALGFSEMTTLVGVVASYSQGRGLYWLCPNWLSSQIKPAEAARAALAEFWRTLPDVIAGRAPSHVQYLHFGPITGELVSGRLRSGTVRLVGGCLAVLTPILAGALGRRLRPDGKWLILEDIKEAPYRLDRHLAALKIAGWLERAAGLLLGDFHMLHEDTQPAVLELLKYHLPANGRTPVVTTRQFGHVWPLVPVPLNRPLALEVRGQTVTIGPRTPAPGHPGT